MTSRKKGFNIIHFPRISIGFTCSSCFKFLKTDSLYCTTIVLFFSARQAYHSLLWNGICFEHWAIIKIISFWRGSLWVGRLISIRSVAVTASNDSDVCFISSTGISFVHPNVLTSVQWQEMCSHFTLPRKIHFAKKSTHTCTCLILQEICWRQIYWRRVKCTRLTSMNTWTSS